MFKPIVESLKDKINKGNREPDEFYCGAKIFLGGAYRMQGQYDEAERHMLKALEVAPWPKESRQEMLYGRVFALLLVDQGYYRKAQETYEEILQIGHSFQNKDLPRSGAIIIQTLKAEFEYGVLHTIQENFDEAETLLKEAHKGIEQIKGPEHRDTVNVKIALAVLRTKQKHYEEAKSLFDEALSNMENRLDDDHPELLRVKSHLGVIYRELGQHDEAEELLTKVHERQAQSKEIGPDHPHTLETMHELGVLYKEQGHYEEAKKYLLDAVNGRLLKLGKTHPQTQESIKTLIALYEVLNEPEKVEKWRAELTSGEDAEKQD